MTSKTVQSLAAAAFAALLSAAAPQSASAQVMHGGYNLGPDYGAMLQQLQRQQQQQNQQMDQVQRQILQNAMQDPICQNYYRQHQMQGGQMSFQQFAYECARRGRFTREGEANAFQVERQNQAGESAARQSLRQAEQHRGQAQQDYMQGFQRNNSEFGNYLQGRNTWINPQSGQQQVLQHTQPGQPSVDPRTGQTYVMDNSGQYYVLAPNGQWLRMNQMR